MSWSLMIWLVVIVLAVVYFTPSIIAYARKHKNFGALLALSIFLGWTLLGWVGALVWSLLRQTPAE